MIFCFRNCLIILSPILLAIDVVSRKYVETAKFGIFAELENPLSIANKLKNISFFEKGKLN